jgi:hypothetical protein
MKCDLCLETPYWSKEGGPDGHQACVDICPAKALKLVHEPPLQTDINGYDIELVPPRAPSGSFMDVFNQDSDDNQKEGE